jgi:hypothetical protein
MKQEEYPKYGGGSMIADNVSGSFVVTRCVTNGTLLVEGVAGKHLIGETVEIFNGDGRKVAELGKVDDSGRFSGNLGPPNPFRVGDVVIIRIGPDVGRATAQ